MLEAVLHAYLTGLVLAAVVSSGVCLTMMLDIELSLTRIARMWLCSVVLWPVTLTLVIVRLGKKP